MVKNYWIHAEPECMQKTKILYDKELWIWKSKSYNAIGWMLINFLLLSMTSWVFTADSLSQHEGFMCLWLSNVSQLLVRLGFGFKLHYCTIKVLVVGPIRWEKLQEYQIYAQTLAPKSKRPKGIFTFQSS